MVAQERYRALWVCLALGLGTRLLYWPVGSFDFINYDDPQYVSSNFHVQHGFTWASLIWCFQAGYAANWHPLTWMSHILDWSLYGSDAGGHHLTNLALHIANALLLFIVLKEMTGAFWRSAMVAALFAWHPMHVESVAWISERKDVLSTLFFLLTLWAYGRYARLADAPELGRVATRRRFYWLSLLCFALGLMAKQMLVTLPFLLLLLDWWPLRRFRQTRAKPGVPAPGLEALLLEKLPFLALALGAGVLTMAAQTQGATRSLADIPLGFRVINALVAYLGYVQKMFWPAGLAEFYPFAYPWPAAQIAAAVLCLAAISVLAVWLGRARPYVAVGWCWFVGTLVPVIGLIQVGDQAMADRYSYIPYIGLFVAGSWGLYDAVSKWRSHRTVLALLATVVLVALGAVTVRQVRYWKDGGTLFPHSIAVTRDNYVSLCSLGGYYSGLGQLTNAQVRLEQALRIAPRCGAAHNLLGHVLKKEGKVETAIGHFEAAIAESPFALEPHLALGNIALERNHPTEAVMHYMAAVKGDPSDAGARFVLGKALLLDGKPAEAQREFSQALRLRPGDAETEYNFGLALALESKWSLAIGHYEAALRLRPNFPDARFYLAVALARAQKWQDAADTYAKLLARQRDNAEAHNNLANVLVHLGKTNEAGFHYAEAVRLRPTFPEANFNLAELLAAEGKLDEAVKHYRVAIKERPTYASARCRLGEIALARALPAEAAEHFAQALTEDPKLAKAQLGLARALAARGKTAEAVEHLEDAIKGQPDWGAAYYELGNLLMAAGKTNEVLTRFTALLQSRPDLAEAHYFVGIVLRERNQAREAAEHWRRAAHARPDWVEVLNNLAWLLATHRDSGLRNGGEALQLAQRAVNLTGGRDPGLLDTLGAALAETGRFAEAGQTTSNALALATAAKDEALVQQLAQHLRLYQKGQAFRE